MFGNASLGNLTYDHNAWETTEEDINITKGPTEKVCCSERFVALFLSSTGLTVLFLVGFVPDYCFSIYIV